VTGGRFASLKVPNYRRYFGGYVISETGDWIQRIGQIWLLLNLNDSPVLLGILAALQHLPMLVLGPWAGLVADRFNRRHILLATQSAGALLALCLGLLATFDLVTAPLLLFLALLLGTVKAIDHPAKQALVFDMVDKERLTNALTLNSITYNTARSVGPAVAGVLIGAFGVPISFYANAASYVVAIIAIRAIRVELLKTQPPVPRAPKQLRAGVAYVRRSPGLLGPLALMTVAGLFAYEWSVAIPLLATQGFTGDAETIGAMFSAMGLGAVLGGLLLAGVLRGTDKVVLTFGTMFSVMVVVLAVSPSLVLVYVALFLLGGVSTVFRASATSLLQQRSEPQMRGRVMGLLAVALMGTSPVGGPLIGFLAELFGIRATLIFAGVITGVAAVAAFVYSRRTAETPADRPPAARPEEERAER
jgi:MFS family permease